MPLELPKGPEQLREYFASVSAAHPEDVHWRNGVEMAERWFAYCRRDDVSQAEIDQFIHRMQQEPNHGSGWFDLLLQFKWWARQKGFRVP